MNNSERGEQLQRRRGLYGLICKTGAEIGVRERSANGARRDELGTDYRVCNLKDYRLWVTLFAATLIT